MDIQGKLSILRSKQAYYRRLLSRGSLAEKCRAFFRLAKLEKEEKELLQEANNGEDE